MGSEMCIRDRLYSGRLPTPLVRPDMASRIPGLMRPAFGGPSGQRSRRSRRTRWQLSTEKRIASNASELCGRAHERHPCAL